MYAVYAACTHPLRTRFLPEIRQKLALVRMYAGKLLVHTLMTNAKEFNP
jgi:hypothetical protein